MKNIFEFFVFLCIFPVFLLLVRENNTQKSFLIDFLKKIYRKEEGLSER
mgnify:FL=1